MRIIVEIGTEDQKAQIQKEIEETFALFAEDLSCNVEVCVTNTFDEKVREISFGEYCSVREDLNHQAVAKVISTSDSKTLVLSGILYSESLDDLCRRVFYLHEIIHMITNHRVSESKTKRDQYVNITNSLFDEYIAYSLSWRVADSLSNRSKLMEEMYECIYKPFLVEVSEELKSNKRIVNTKVKIKRGEISVEEGLQEIEKYVFDILLKIMIIYGMDKETEVVLPLCIQNIVKEFDRRSCIKPQWFETEDYIISVLEYYGIWFIDEEMREFRICL